MSRLGRSLFYCLAVITLATGCGTESPDTADTTTVETPQPPAPAPVTVAGNVDDARVIAAAANEPGSWLAYGQTYKEQRFSMLTQINRDNVNDLGLAWTKAVGDWNQRMQGTPLVIDGVMYVSNGWSVVYALDAATGEELWSFDPEVDRSFIICSH